MARGAGAAPGGAGAAKAAGTAQSAGAARGAGGAERGAGEKARARPAAARAPELEARARRYAETYGLDAGDAELITRDAATADLFEAALGGGASPRAVANWIIHELPRERRDREIGELPFGGRELGALVALVEEGVISSSAGREVLAELADKGGDPAAIVERRGLRQVSDEAALRPVVDDVLAANPAKIAEYRAGRTGLLGFFVGQVMGRTGGRANPERVRALLEAALAADG
jgi:Asp-tRNA(Asn)/Glu-tRNA(Gln) amidotransferase B subunit